MSALLQRDSGGHSQTTGWHTQAERFVAIMNSRALEMRPEYSEHNVSNGIRSSHMKKSNSSVSASKKFNSKEYLIGIQFWEHGLVPQ